MTSRTRTILGYTTIILIIGGTIYAIKKSRDLKKDMDESMSVSDARAEVEAYREAVEDDMEGPDMDELKDDIHDEVGWNLSFLRGPEDDTEEGETLEFKVPIGEIIQDKGIDMDQVKEENRAVASVISTMRTDAENEDVIHDDGGFETDPEEETDFTFGELSFTAPLIETMTEEDKVLRYEPNSNAARNQFIRMELAEWLPSEDTYLIMLNLFNFPFNPLNDGDWDTKTRIIDYRVNFFGFESRWAKEVTYADIILHYARLIVFNLGEDMRYWVNHILDLNEFSLMMSSQETDNLIVMLNMHTYHNDSTDTYGLFGLTAEGVDGARNIANRNIDRQLTYEIEFNEFIKSCM